MFTYSKSLAFKTNFRCLVTREKYLRLRIVRDIMQFKLLFQASTLHFLLLETRVIVLCFLEIRYLLKTFVEPKV